MNQGYLALKKNSAYKEVYRRGKSDGNSWFTVFFSINCEGKTRAGISISKKVGKAHERNYIKRRMRVILRDKFFLLPEGFDFVFMIKPKAKGLSFSELSGNFEKLVEKLKKK